MSDNTVMYKGYEIEIEQDEYPENPRDWDNLGVMHCSHRRYNLGDVQIEHGNFSCWEEVQDYLNKTYNPVVILPLWLYDHSGLSMKTFRHGYHGGWDCGVVGYILATREAICKWYGVKHLTKHTIERATALLEQEIETYNQYLNGDVYCLTIRDPEGEEIENVCGCFEYDYTLKEAKATVDNDIAHREAKQWNQLHEMEVIE